MIALIKKVIRGFDAALLRQAQLDLLQPNFKYKITVAIDRNGDIRLFAPNVTAKDEVKEMCNGLMRGASLLAYKGGLQMRIGKD